MADCNTFFSKTGFKNVHFAEADLTTLSEKEAYDLILCVDVMEHIEEDEKVLRNFYNAMKPGGLLVISNLLTRVDRMFTTRPWEGGSIRY